MPQLTFVRQALASNSVNIACRLQLPGGQVRGLPGPRVPHAVRRPFRSRSCVCSFEQEDQRGLRATPTGAIGGASSDSPRNPGAAHARQYLSFEEARALVQEQSLDSPEQFVEWWNSCKGVVPGRSECVPASPNITYQQTGWSSWVDWLGRRNEPLWEFWKGTILANDPHMDEDKVEQRGNWLYMTTLRVHQRSCLSELEIAQHANLASSLLGFDTYDTLQVALAEPKILELSPSDLVKNMMALKYVRLFRRRTLPVPDKLEFLPSAMDATVMVRRFPELLVTDNSGDSKARLAVERLSLVLPDACVAWLMLEEPWLLTGVPDERIEQIKMTSTFFQHRLDEIAAIEGAYNRQELRDWFKMEYSDSYFGKQKPVIW